ncbi:MAG: energy transducer TonB [Blastocatellales bacterium]|nr:energy transducer TonB [Blastocatellales bacterium]
MAIFKLNDRRFMLMAALALACAVASSAAHAQQNDRVYGPVVNSYLLGLAEELGELEFLVARGEITRQSFERARARLTVARRYVERTAKERREDRVPAFQVLAADELNALGPGLAPAVDELRLGATVRQKWKLVAIEEAPARFYVFEALRAPAAASAVDPLSAIETILVEEKSFNPHPPPPPTAPAAEPEIPPVPPQTALPAAAAHPGPRVITYYLPAYSREARAKAIEGEVVVSALFRRDGKIRDITLVQRLGHGLDERAREAVRRIEYEPARRDGQAVDARALITFNFRLMRVTVQMHPATPLDP